MAKKFRFSLEALLKLRTYTVEIKKSALAEIVRLREEQSRLIEEKQFYLSEIISSDYMLKTDAGAMQAVFSHRELIQKELDELHQKKMQIIEIENLRRNEYFESVKEVKILEKLKEQQKEVHRFEINREEQAFLDETAQKISNSSK